MSRGRLKPFRDFLVYCTPGISFESSKITFSMVAIGLKPVLWEPNLQGTGTGTSTEPVVESTWCCSSIFVIL
jgi:hypothetical protein